MYKPKPSLWHFSGAATDAENASKNYQIAMATGDKNMWDMYVLYFGFSLDYCKVLDERSTPFVLETERLLELHHQLSKYHDFSLTPNPHNVNRVVTILKILQTETTKLWLKEITRYKLVDKLTNASEEELKIIAKKAIGWEEGNTTSVLDDFIYLTKTYIKKCVLSHVH